MSNDLSQHPNNKTIRNIGSFIDSAGWEKKKAMYTEVFNYAILSDGARKKPNISIIVISWKHNENLEEALVTAGNQKGVIKDIIFVNNGAEKKLHWCKKYSDTYIELKENTGAYLARNIGALFSKAEVLLFIDDDGISEERLALSHYKVHKNMPQILSTRGVCLPISSENSGDTPDHYYLGEKMLCAIPNLEGNSAFKREPFISIGGWDDRIAFGHGGLEITSRLLREHRCIRSFAYIPHAILFHDYIKDKLHSDEKKRKQERAMDYLRNKDSEIDRIRKSFIEEREIIPVPSSINRDIKATIRKYKKELTQHTKRMKETFGCEDISTISLLKKLSKSYEIYALGAGSLGERFAELCQERRIKVACFFDKKSNKSKLNNFSVERLRQPAKNCILVVTTSQKESAFSEVESKGLKFKKTFVFR